MAYQIVIPDSKELEAVETSDVEEVDPFDAYISLNAALWTKVVMAFQEHMAIKKGIPGTDEIRTYLSQLDEETWDEEFTKFLNDVKITYVEAGDE